MLSYIAEAAGSDVEDLICTDNCNFNSSCETSPVSRQPSNIITQSLRVANQEQSSSVSQVIANINKHVVVPDKKHEATMKNVNDSAVPGMYNGEPLLTIVEPSENDNMPPKNDDRAIVSSQGIDTSSSSNVSVHNTPHCGTSSLISIPVISNASPIGGMSYFKVDAPASRYISSGVKIDFQDGQGRRSSPSSLKHLQNSVTLSPTMGGVSNTKNSFSSSTQAQEFQVFSIQPKRPISSTPTGKKNTFSIFEERNHSSNHTNSSSRNKSEKVSSTITLRDLDPNTMANQSDAKNVIMRERQPKKRRPSGSLGNESKKQIM